MKAKIRVATREYEFIELEAEVENEQEAIELYNASVRAYTAQGEGLEHRAWCRAVDEFLNTGGGGLTPDVFENMSPKQREFINELRRALKRLKEDKND